MKIRLYQPIVFDGETIEGEIDTDKTRVNGESIIQRGWGEEVVESKGSMKSKPSEPVEPTEPAPGPELDPSPSAPQAAEPSAVEVAAKPIKTRKGK